MSDLTVHVVIIGAMAAGKTTVGRGVAERLGLEFFDSDEQIRDLTGNSGAQIARAEGVDALHRMELQVFWAAMRSPAPSVIAAAASVIEDPEAREALLRSRCVWLHAEDETRRRRRASGSHRREVTELEARLLEARDPLFAGCADVRIDTGAVSEHDAVSIAVAAITERNDG
jgi:shikimate kinase